MTFCIHGCKISDDDLGAEQMEDRTWRCGKHVDELFSHAENENLDSLGRPKREYRQATTQSVFNGSLGTFATRKRELEGEKL